jgi:hypothetical protein
VKGQNLKLNLSSFLRKLQIYKKNFILKVVESLEETGLKHADPLVRTAIRVVTDLLRDATEI